VAGQYDRIVQPGESGKIPVKLSLGTHGGKQMKNITVYTNIPGEGGSVKLSLQGEVWLPVDVQPTTVTFGRLTSESASDPAQIQKVAITSNEEQSVELTNIRSTNPVYRAELTVIEAGKKFELRVALASPPKPGNNAGTIEITTGLKELPTLSVPVNAFVAPDVEVMPATLALPVEMTTATTRQLFVKNNAKAPMELSGLESSNPKMKVTLDETQPGMAYKLTVQVPAGHQVPEVGDKITFKTNNPTVPLVTVPVTQLKTPTTAPAPGRPSPVVPGATPAQPVAPGAAAPAPKVIPGKLQTPTTMPATPAKGAADAKAPGSVQRPVAPQNPAGTKAPAAPPPAPATAQPGAGAGGKSNG
jgi:hypothetical protein